MTSSALVPSASTDRTAEVSRNTAETRITVRLNLDGTGQASLHTGIGFFDHMLEQIARHGLIDLEVHADGDLHIDGHHTVEDVGITIGQAQAWRVTEHDYPHALVRLHWCKVTEWTGEFEMREGQQMAWQQLPLDVHPVLPGSYPVLQWLSDERGLSFDAQYYEDKQPA